MTRILIIEDEIIIARFIEQQLQAHFACEIHIAISAAEARAAMPQALPHLLLCDINLQAASTGIDLVKELQLQYPFEIIFITSYQTKSIIEQAAAASPANYIIKPVDEMQLFAGVRLAMDKIEAFTSAEDQQPSPADVLNSTERRIVQMIRLQKSTREIAVALNLSPYTIKNQRHKICRKLKLKDENNALLKWALEHAGKLQKEPA